MSSVPEEIKTSRRKHDRVFFFFFFLMLLKYIYTIYKNNCTLYTYVQISSNLWDVGGSVEQPPPVPDGKALNQPKPHPSDKIV